MRKKNLLIQFRFNSHSIKVSRSHVDGYSLDKYLTLDTWAQIYTKLTDPINAYVEDTSKTPDSTSIKMNRAQLHLKISWTAIDAMHRQLTIIENLDNSNVCPLMMNVHIDVWSMIDKYKKDNKIKTESPPSTNGNGTSSKNATAKISPPKKAITTADLAVKLKLTKEIDTDEEYVPPASGNVEFLQYTPSSVTSAKSEEYMPTNGSDDADHIVSYTPTKISKSHSDDVIDAKKYGQNSKTDANRNDYNSKRDKTSIKTDAFADLFGDSDDSVGAMTRSAKKSAQQRLHVTHRKASKHTSNETKIQTNLSQWVTTKDDCNSLDDLKSMKEPNKKRRIDTSHPIEMRENIDANALKNGKEPKTDEADRMKLLSAKLDKKLEKSSRKVDTLYVFILFLLSFFFIDSTICDIIFLYSDLTLISTKEITASFKAHQTILSAIFDNYKDAPQYSFPKLGYDPIKFIETLLTADQQKAMITKMKAHFCPDEEYGITSVNLHFCLVGTDIL